MTDCEANFCGREAVAVARRTGYGTLRVCDEHAEDWTVVEEVLPHGR